MSPDITDIDVIRKRQYSSPTANADVATLLAEVDRLNGVVAERDAQIDNEIDTITELGMRCEYITVLGNAMSDAIGGYVRTLGPSSDAKHAWDNR